MRSKRNKMYCLYSSHDYTFFRSPRFPIAENENDQGPSEAYSEGNHSTCREIHQELPASERHDRDTDAGAILGGKRLLQRATLAQELPTGFARTFL